MNKLLIVLFSFTGVLTCLAQEYDKSANIVTSYTKMENQLYLKTNNFNKSDPHIEIYLIREELNQLQNIFDSTENLILFLENERINGYEHRAPKKSQRKRASSFVNIETEEKGCLIDDSLFSYNLNNNINNLENIVIEKNVGELFTDYSSKNYEIAYRA